MRDELPFLSLLPLQAELQMLFPFPAILSVLGPKECALFQTSHASVNEKLKPQKLLLLCKLGSKTQSLGFVPGSRSNGQAFSGSWVVEIWHCGENNSQARLTQPWWSVQCTLNNSLFPLCTPSSSLRCCSWSSAAPFLRTHSCKWCCRSCAASLCQRELAGLTSLGSPCSDTWTFTISYTRYVLDF